MKRGLRPGNDKHHGRPLECHSVHADRRLAPICTSASIRADVIAGIAVAGLLVPEGMAYAGIAEVAPQIGLYAAMAAMFFYALFGLHVNLCWAAFLVRVTSPTFAGIPRLSPYREYCSSDQTPCCFLL